MKTPKEQSVEEIVEELQGKIGIILDKARRQNWKNGGVLEYDSLDLLAESDEIIRTTLTHHITQIRKDAVEEVLAELSKQDMHAEVIRETLGHGHHYSTMPVVAGIVSKIKERLNMTNI